MLTVSINAKFPDFLDVKCPFYAVNRLKMHCVNPKFDWDRKVWLIARHHVDSLLREFPGELYFKTPLWMIKNEPMPDMTSLYHIDPNIALPEMKIPLYDYQSFGARFMIDRILRNGMVINSDGCGLGKTPQGLAVMQWFRDNREAKRFLIIAKKSIKAQWKGEIARFTMFEETSNFPIEYTPDTKKKRERVYKKILDADQGILIVNYENFLNDTDMIRKINFDMVIIDEAHCVKTRQGIKNNNIGHVIHGCPTVFLTGTPIMSRPEDLYGIVQMANPDYFGNWDEFQEKYLVVEDRGYYTSVVGAKHLDVLRDLTQDIVIRRTEHEIAVNLPSVITKNISVDADKIQRNIISAIDQECSSYQWELNELLQQIKSSQVDSSTKKGLRERVTFLSSVLKGYIACRQFTATDPGAFSFSKARMLNPYRKMIPANYKMSPKTEAVLNEIREILDNEEKVILFSKFVTIGLYLKTVVEKELKVNVLMYTGKENTEQRAENIKLFRFSDQYNILIGSDAMAEGLNLAEARHIINIDLPDTYAIYQQRIGRARRVSSAYSTVIVHNCLTADSVDISKMDTLKNNRDLDGALIGSDKAQSEALKKALVNQNAV